MDLLVQSETRPLTSKSWEVEDAPQGNAGMLFDMIHYTVGRLIGDLRTSQLTISNPRGQ